MTALFTDSEIVASIPPPTRRDWYIVLAIWQGHWGMPKGRGPFTTAEAAQEWSATLGVGWSNIRIVRIPGEGA